MADSAADFLLSSYQFDLPERQIAQHPAPSRTESRLMVLDKTAGTTITSMFSRLADFLPENCLLVANNSQVIPARLNGFRETGGKVEFLLLTPLPLLVIEPETPHNTQDTWYEAAAEGLLRSSKRIASGETVTFSPDLSLTLTQRNDYGNCNVRLRWRGNIKNLLNSLGQLPLPPYIKRTSSHPDSSANATAHHDRERYQTVYARHDKAGSVAAPTAGLHFTPELQANLIASGRQWAEVTLYVGYGTFSPVRTEDIRDHAMHAEYVEISAEAAATINAAKAEGRPIIAIGTTSARVLEGVYLAQRHSATSTTLAPFKGWINIFLYPGKPFHVIDGLVTNFHLPESSLLMLVSAFAGRERTLNAYHQAVSEGFRFFSYGDAMLIV